MSEQKLRNEQDTSNAKDTGHNRDAEDTRETNRPVRPESGGHTRAEELPRGGAR